jgi:hypothetical protein
MLRPTPYQQIVAAIRFGIQLKPSGKMQWTANVTALAPWPSGDQHVSVFPIEADSDLAAARIAAESVARRVYGENWMVGPINRIDGETSPLFRASAGSYHNGRITGSTLQVLVREYAAK